MSGAKRSMRGERSGRLTVWQHIFNKQRCVRLERGNERTRRMAKGGASHTRIPAVLHVVLFEVNSTFPIKIYLQHTIGTLELKSIPTQLKLK